MWTGKYCERCDKLGIEMCKCNKPPRFDQTTATTAAKLFVSETGVTVVVHKIQDVLGEYYDFALLSDVETGGLQWLPDSWKVEIIWA